MKILLVTPYYLDSYPQHLSMGSAVKQAENLSSEHQILVLTTGREKQNQKVSANLTIRSVIGLLLPDPINYCIAPAVFPEFIRQVKVFKPDVVMVSKYMFFTSFIIPLAKLMGLRVITTTDTFPGINWFPRSRPVAAVMWLYARLIGLPLLWMSDKVILLYSGLEPIAKKYHLKFVTIPNGVDDSYFEKQPKPKDIYKPKGEFWVGFVGRPESIKGYDLALKAADYFAIGDPKVKFVFVGGNAKPHTDGNKIFLGFRSDIKQIYQLFDCLILPSYAEGLPNVLLEAMAQGVPCIASRVGGVTSIIDTEVNGLLIKRGSFREITSAISRIKTSNIDKFRTAAKNTIKNKFSLNSTNLLYKKTITGAGV